jgi:hypothetical protein
VAENALPGAAGFVKAAHMTRTRNLTAGLMAFAASAALVAGCASRDDSPPPIPIAPISGPQPIDGMYSGFMQLIRGGAMNCGDGNEFRLQVSGQSFTYRLSQQSVAWKPVVVLTGAIAPDGSFDATSGTSFMRGALKNGHMQGRISGDACGFDFSADRTGTF